MHQSVELDQSWKPHFVHPFTSILAGPTGCGKTTFIFRFIGEVKYLMTQPPEKTLCIATGNTSPYLPIIRKSNFTKDSQAYRLQENIVDNWRSDKRKCYERRTFTKGSHHRSVCNIAENLFYKSKDSRTMSLISCYIGADKNRRDVTQIATVVKQLYIPGKKIHGRGLPGCHIKPVRVFVNLCRAQTDKWIRLRTNIFFPGLRKY